MNLQSSEENPGCKENRTDPEEIEGLERCYALDTAALMGGNEYLVFEIIDKLTQCTYNKEESLALKWALSKLWTDEEGTNEFLKTCDLNQGHLLDFFTPQMKESLPRIVATGLLFSGRYDDTKVYQNIDDPNNNVIALNMMHHNFESPIGKTMNGTLCNQIALLYFSPPEDHNLAQLSPRKERRNQARRISESLALEKEMLSLINVFAIFPIP
ncbi:uncharacterized protein [Lepeophtheirus salmonis]|uniref:Uncharacterized protein n=1 Tax=Lepeophtheirus salmonis TaxID=72036 RepID=A0A0K2TYM4_LEPSM|nr:uncharacterized protein LOC121127804 isoform X2 [Lepeophtheirus salmonis]